MKTSFIVCTFNRAIELHDLLKGFSLAKNYLLDCELVIVNNNCSDNTSEIIVSFENMLPIREVFEPKQGINFARNRGVIESQGANLVFFDDDVLIDTDVVKGYLDAFANNDRFDFFGGRINPHWADGKPNWVKDENLALLRGLYGNHDYGDLDIVYDNGMDIPFGASFAIRRRVIDRIGMFDETLCRGEETDLILRAQRHGAKGLYLGHGCAFHKVKKANLSLRAITKAGWLSGRAQRQINNHAKKKNVFMQLIVFSLRGLVQKVKGRGDRSRQCLINMAMLLGSKFG